MVLSKKPEQIAHYSLQGTAKNTCNWWSISVSSCTVCYCCVLADKREHQTDYVWQEYFDI